MPIYEYECNACGSQVEFIQKFSDSPKRKCPDCGALRLRRLVSAAAFHLKGTGWYVTDFRDKDKANGKDKAKKAEKAEKAEKETKSESKSASKSSSTSGAGSSTD